MEILKDTVAQIKVIDKVICNCCGCEIEVDTFGYLQDYVHIDKAWGYNSQKDGAITSVDICEKCFDDIIKNFAVKP